MSVIEYEQEFVRLSQYVRECLSTKATMCKRFIEGLNEDIKLLVGILDINEFAVLVERAYKAEELSKEKKKADFEARDERKGSISKTSQPLMKSFGDASNRSNASFGHPSRDRARQSVGLKTQAQIESSVGSAKSNKLECRQCGRRHVGECWENVQSARSSNMTVRGKPPRNTGNVSGSQRGTTDTAVRSKARAPTRAYAIRAREEASSPDVITSTFTLFDTDVISLIDPGSTHSYMCVNLVSSKTLPVESTEFVITVSNPLGKCALVDKVCKNCPLMFQDVCFPANLVLLPFDDFDITLGLPAVVSLMKALNYVRKGCEAYLAYVIDTKVSEKKVEFVPVVCEFPDVFPKKLSGLHPMQEVEFSIELVSGTTPISIAPYRMAPTKLKELNSQLQELTDRGFAQLSFSP
ncbi:Gag-Pol polyprotein [Gossypium australe]|uniref:Gag-Pol polyprotein n=1 Tax=Gossypium australe TaxID=47621 RepID=A0A5B6VYE3_9ROSI|nr:Gag-Pol polyprotein [Gossypium australe]